MDKQTVYCPMLKKEIPSDLCRNITFATEGRISRAAVAEAIAWDAAREICSDCGNAYWNRGNNMEAPEIESRDII